MIAAALIVLVLVACTYIGYFRGHLVAGLALGVLLGAVVLTLALTATPH